MRPLEQHKEPALGVGQFAELGQLRAFQRQLLQLLRGLVKILAQTCVIVDQLRIVENEMLADEPLQRRCLLVELPARAPRLRCLQDRLRRAPDDIPMLALAPAVLRLERDAGTPVRSLGGKPARRLAERLAALAGRELGG